MIKLTELCCTFNAGTPDARRAVDAVSLIIERGAFVALIGGNGAGKSTLLNLVSGAAASDAGTIEIDGIDVTGLLEHRRAAYVSRVFQDPMVGTAPSLTVEENLALAEQRTEGRGWRRALSGARRERYRAALSILGLGIEARLTQRVGTLSGGQRQALALVMATLHAPRVLLLDEHTAALDPRTSALVMEATTRVVKAQQLTTIMVTHNMAHALAVASRVVILGDGRVRGDLDGAAITGLTVADLVARFHITDDRLALSR